MVMALVIAGAKKKLFLKETKKERKKEIYESFTNDHSQSRCSCEQAYQPAIVQPPPDAYVWRRKDFIVESPHPRTEDPRSWLRGSNPGGPGSSTIRSRIFTALPTGLLKPTGRIDLNSGQELWTEVCCQTASI